jgi:hypothetical protein
MDGHSLNNIPKAIIHIQAHGLDDNQSRLTYPGVELFPTKGMASVGYNSFGIMRFCNNDFNITLNIIDTTGELRHISIFVPSSGVTEVTIILPPGETITTVMGKKIGLNGQEIYKLNHGEAITKGLGAISGAISIETALLISTSMFFNKITEFLSQGIQISQEEKINTLISLHKRMYNLCGIKDFPNCNNRRMSGFYKEIFYTFDKIYSIYPNQGEDDICSMITTEQGSQIHVENPQPYSPYGIYIMNSTLQYLHDISLRYIPPKNTFFKNKITF